MENQEIRTALDRHWAASAAGDIEAEHEIYHDDVLVEYPQSGERIRGRHNIQALRGHHPAKLGFTIRRILGIMSHPEFFCDLSNRKRVGKEGHS